MLSPERISAEIFLHDMPLMVMRSCSNASFTSLRERRNTAAMTQSLRNEEAKYRSVIRVLLGGMFSEECAQITSV